ncbi:STAS domain-containing protein [Alteromonadaceae bacterium BrNp21-10]|nr:STAS domain-containing protein [Alteromonadaceae bacterium BrNp21-10]
MDVKLSATNTFEFAGALTRNTVVGAWPNRRIQWAALDADVIFDLAQVTAIDTAGLAWLIQLTSECQQAEKQLTVRHVPTSLLKLAKISDVEGLLPLQ